MRILLLLALPLILSAAPAAACGAETPCRVEGRTYHAAPPPNWNGADPLPVLVHLHGWGRTGAQVLRNRRIAPAAADSGLLLLAPEGIGRSWRFWSAGDDRDVAFVEAVLDDAARRWPIDRRRVVISGFSYGGAMVWRIACARGDAFAGYLPIAGALWREGEERCAAPGRLWHVHGAQDGVMRPPVERPGRVETGLSLWRAAIGATASDSLEAPGRAACRRWRGAGEAMLCLHPGGHWIPRDWLAWALPRMLAPR